jgi:hypothetical protein
VEPQSRCNCEIRADTAAADADMTCRTWQGETQSMPRERVSGGALIVARQVSAAALAATARREVGGVMEQPGLKMVSWRDSG